MNQTFCTVFGFNDFFLLFIGFGISLGVFNHLVDFVFTQTAGSLNTNSLLFVGCLIFGRNVYNTVGVDIKGNFNLRHTARRRRNTHQIKLT